LVDFILYGVLLLFIGEQVKTIIPFYAIDPELFDFHQFRFSFGETTEEAIKKRKSKS